MDVCFSMHFSLALDIAFVIYYKLFFSLCLFCIQEPVDLIGEMLIMCILLLFLGLFYRLIRNITCVFV